MTTETILGIAAVLVIVGFLAFALRQGMKARKKPVGVPPERFSEHWRP
jgi:hypothetical protein